MQPSATLEIDGEKYELVYDYNAIADAEILTGNSCNLLHGLVAPSSISALQLRGLLLASLKPRQPALTMADAGKLIRLDTIHAICGPSAKRGRFPCRSRQQTPPRPPGQAKLRAAINQSEALGELLVGGPVHPRPDGPAVGELTPRQFYLLLDRHKESVELNKTLAGIVAAAVANFGYRAPERYLTPRDFVGGPDEPAEPKPHVNRKKQVAKLRAFLNSQVRR